MSENPPPSLSFADAAPEGTPASPAYIDAVNAARFVKGFGITALVYSLTTVCGIGLLSGGIGLGVGLFILRYDTGTYYKYLGIAVIVMALIGAAIPLGVFICPIVLSGAVLWKGVEILRLLSREGQGDEDWQTTRTRAVIGTITSGVGITISLVLLLLSIVAMILLASKRFPQS